MTSTTAMPVLLTFMYNNPDKHASLRYIIPKNAQDRRRPSATPRELRAFRKVHPALTAEGATKLVEELGACRMPYVCPRGKPVMIFTSTRELDRKFNRL